MELGSMGVEVLMVGALGWPTPTEDMGFWRPALGELSLAGERDKAISCDAETQHDVATWPHHLPVDAFTWQHDTVKTLE